MSSNVSSASDAPNKVDLYGRFQAVEDWNADRLKWQNELHRKAAHKALDIGDPDDVGDINANRTGIDAEGLAKILGTVKPKAAGGLGKLALALGLGGPLIAGAVMAPAIIRELNDDPAPVVIEQEAGEDTDTNTEYELQFFED